MDIIGVGFGRTGSTSLKAALERLGFGPCHHMTDLLRLPERADLWEAAADGEEADWEALFAGFRSTVDWPGTAFWRELVARYPDARVILSVRDPDRWYESARSTIGRELRPGTWRPEAVPLLRVVERVVWQRTFDGRFGEPDHAKQVFTDHAAQVREAVEPGRLLVHEISKGWEPLCAFLGVPVPDEPFPRLNDRVSFLRRHVPEA
ncbi:MULTISPECIES: sulfotransferase family protein [unclassified Streptomyces]|uniref:sulfotransferase family protein n=1 Tax=unclassified Streptomyces TaxID=2593676 RepID=UPI00344B20D7